MRNICGLFVCCIMLTTTLTGCWDRRELNDLAIVVGLGLDKQDDQLEVTTQIVNPGEVTTSKGGGGYSLPVTTLEVTESTTIEALRKLTTIAPRRIFSSHLRVLVIGESLARDGIAKVMDGISRNHEMRSDFYIIISKGTSAQDVLEILTPLDKIPANSLFAKLETSEKLWAPTVKLQLDKVITTLQNPSRGTVLSGIKIIGDEELGKTRGNLDKSESHALLQYSGLALFKDDKLVDWLNEEESKGYNYIMGNVKNTVGHINCPNGGLIAVDVTRTKSKIKGKIVRGKPEILIDLFVEENISENQCGIDLTKTNNIKDLEETGNKKLTEIMEAAIQKAKDNQTDIFGFGEVIEDEDPRSWLKMKNEWDEYFEDLDITIKVDTQIRRFGTINNSLLKRKD